MKPKKLQTLITMKPADFVTIDLAETVTGYSDKAIRRKIEDGVWRENEVWVKADDGRILIYIPGYNRWAAGGKVKAAA